MKKPSRYTSIIFVHYSDNDRRKALMQKSFYSLVNSVRGLPVEIIVVNNGVKSVDWYFQGFLDSGDIVTYILNAENMHFGFARNQGIANAAGNYIAIVDDDIIYKEGWLQDCWKVLEAYPDKKIYATPLHYPTPVLKERYDQGTLEVDGKSYQLNMRAGSNCFVIREEDLHKIGLFKYHRIAGTKWTDDAVHAGYLAAVCPDEMVIDEGLRNGYNHAKAIPIQRTLLDDSHIKFNQDELEK